jgi:DNA polymerase-1
MIKPTTLDFETFGIEKRPDYPPKPVGVAIKPWGQEAKYYAFGHIEGNNCTFEEARQAVLEAFACPDGVVCQNAKFDIDVAEVHMGVTPPSWDKIHDTMFLLFLDDPHQEKLGLKEAALRLFGDAPDEQDAVKTWLLKNHLVNGKRIKPSEAGRYIAYAPADLVGKYALGDVVRTEKIFDKLYPSIIEREMLSAYLREQKLMLILLDMERRGLNVGINKLRDDVTAYTEVLRNLEQWLFTRLGGVFNVDSGADLFSALAAAEVIDKDKVTYTEKGNIETNKDALISYVADKVVLGVLRYRAQLTTCLDTFMRPWLETAEKSNGLIYTNWNQVKSPGKGKKLKGAGTGRMSSSPNFQNIPKEFKPIFDHDAPNKGLPIAPITLPALPKVRAYITPFAAHTLLDRDYSQQEARILAHFDDGVLMDTYKETPRIDFHDSARDKLAAAGKDYPRGAVKTINFGLIYGMGYRELAESSGLSLNEAKLLKRSILSMYPGISNLFDDMRQRARLHIPIRTWGGRQYYCEVKDGDLKDYKMVNLLIQGSAADCTKEAIIRFYDAKMQHPLGTQWHIVLAVHDQITISVPQSDIAEAMEVLRIAMESIEFDVPMLSEGSISHTNWSELVDYDKKGVLIANNPLQTA